MIIKQLMIADYNLRNYESISMLNVNIPLWKVLKTIVQVR